MTKTQDREFDIVVFGATGFSGAANARYLAAHAPADVSIALAGRSEKKLQKIRSSLPSRAAQWPLIVADVDTPSTLDAMAARTKVIVTSVGPWMRYGENLLAAAVNAGCHYLDLTAEVPFVRWSIDKYHEQAVANGSRIVHSAGFDSIPSDLPVYMLYKNAAEDNQGTLTDTTTIVRKIVMVPSGGSVDTGRVYAEQAFKKGFLRMMLDPDSLTDSPGVPTRPRTRQPRDLRIVRAAKVDPSLRGTLAPFIASFYNARVVRRTNALLDGAYGPQFRYSEALAVTQLPIVSTIAAGIITAGYAIGLGAFALPPVRRLIDFALPKPGSGPGETITAKGSLSVETYTRTTTGTRYVARLQADCEPGYVMTSIMIGESALALVCDGDRLPPAAGVLTPVAALGDVLIERLNAADLITLSCDRLN